MKRMAKLGGTIFILFFFFAALSARAQTIPPINSKTLNDTQITLPNSGTSQPLILVVGFSHKSSESCGPWGKISLSHASASRSWELMQTTSLRKSELEMGSLFQRSYYSLHSMRLFWN